MRIGTAVVLRSELEPHLVTNGIEWDDLRLHQPEFQSKYGYTQNQWLNGQASNQSYRFIPWFVINTPRNRIKIINSQTGKLKTVTPSEILPGCAEPHKQNQKFSWSPLSCYQTGSATSIPLPPLDSGRPSVLLHNNRWIGLHHIDSDNVACFSPRKKWEAIEVVDFVAGLPWIHRNRSRASHSKTGAGYIVKVPENTVRYYKGWKNNLASEYIAQSESGYDYFYIPINRIEWAFQFNTPVASKSWFSINWCFSGFQHLFSIASTQTLNNGSTILVV